MKKLNSDFEARLEREFDNQIRMRWSNQRGEWQVEYKVARGQVPNVYVSEWDDRLIRARDGYGYLMSVREGDRMPCPTCGSTLKVPLFEVAEVRCDYCVYNGRDGRHTACYFPLEGDSFLYHLRKLDPIRGWRDKIAAEVDANNDANLRAAERKFERDIEAITKDNFKQLVGIQSVGYTGKEFK